MYAARVSNRSGGRGRGGRQGGHKFGPRIRVVSRVVIVWRINVGSGIGKHGNGPVGGLVVPVLKVGSAHAHVIPPVISRGNHGTAVQGTVAHRRVLAQNIPVYVVDHHPESVGGVLGDNRLERPLFAGRQLDTAKRLVDHVIVIGRVGNDTPRYDGRGITIFLAKFRVWMAARQPRRIRPVLELEPLC